MNPWKILQQNSGRNFEGIPKVVPKGMPKQDSKGIPEKFPNELLEEHLKKLPKKCWSQK